MTRLASLLIALLAAAPVAAKVPADTLAAVSAAWARGDATAIGQQFTADAEFVAADGSVFGGAAQVAQVFTAQFADRYAQSTLATHVAASKAITPGVAWLRGDWTVAKGGAPLDCGTFVAVLRATPGGWRVAVFDETGAPCPAKP